MSDPTDDERHCALANRFIAAMNAAAAEGYSMDFVASAAVAAAGSYTAFNLSDGYKTAIKLCDVYWSAKQFRGRVQEAAQRHMPPVAGKGRTQR